MAKISIQTKGGHQIDLENPAVEDIDIEDIAHSLSMQCRYNGHVRKFYSVAEHCVHVSKATAQVGYLPLWGLLHDAGEAYVSDIITPIKECLPKFNEIEAKVLGVVAEKFSLPANWTLCDGVRGVVKVPEVVDKVDKLMFVPEAFQLFPAAHPVVEKARGCLAEALNRRQFDTSTIKCLNTRIEAWPPEVAKFKFLERFAQLRAAALERKYH